MFRLILDICGVFFIAELIILAGILAIAWNVRRENEKKMEDYYKDQLDE